MKNRLLIISAVLMLFCIYKLAISETLSSMTQCAELEQQVQGLENIPARINDLKKKIRTTQSYTSNQTGKQKELLEIVSSYCEKEHLVLREFPKVEREIKENLEVETNRFTVQGEFPSLLKLVYDLEQKDQVGRIASVNYRLQKDPKTKSTSLCAEIYVQQIKNTDHEI